MKKLDTETLYEVYKALNKRFSKIQNQIDQIDEKIKHCKPIDKDFLEGSRKTMVDMLCGLKIAIDMVFHGLTQDKLH